MIFALINLLFYLCYDYLLSVYYNEIGAINENKLSARINCNYELFVFLNKCVIFILSYILNAFVFTKIFNLPNILIPVLQIFICTPLNFLANKLWAFK